MNKKPNLKIVKDIKDKEYSYKETIHCNTGIKPRSTKRMTEYYNSEQFESDLGHSKEMAQKCKNNDDIKKEFRNIDIESSIPKNKSLSETESFLCRKDYRILIVDDNKEVRETIKEFLKEACGFTEIDTASNGEEAVDRTKSRQYDLILSDYNMPKMDGYALWRYLKDTKYLTTFIMISGYCEYQVKNLRRVGVFCLPKGDINCFRTLEKLAIGYYARKLAKRLAYIATK